MGLFGSLRRKQRTGGSTDNSEAAAVKQSPGRSRGQTEDPGALEPQDSAVDPALLAAILESLQAHHPNGSCGLPAGGRFLCRNLSEADPALAGQLRQRRAAQLHVSHDGIAYFEHSEDDFPLTLPSFQGYPPEVRRQVLGQLCNEWLQQEAEEAGVINCIPGCTPQLVLNTQGDGNCMSHACSLGVWGVHDRDQAIRGAIRATMTHPVAGMEIKLRFERQLQQNGIPPEEWPSEWRRELGAFHNTARMSDQYLSDVHCFTLANVLRRPLVLYGDRHAGLAGLSGIYLPLLWPPSACRREPVALLFWGSHFSLLCTTEGEGPASPQLLPLCTRDGPLQVRFLSVSEERQHGSAGQGPPLGLLQQYMACELLPGDATVWLQRQQAQSPFEGSCTVHTCGTAAGRGEGAAVGVRLSSAPTQQVLLHLLEAAFVQQVAAQCPGYRRVTLGKRWSSVGGGSRRGSLGGEEQGEQSLAVAT